MVSWLCRAVVYSPRTRLRARILGLVALYVFCLNFVRASGEAILGTQRYLEQCVFLTFVSCLRRGDFRYTKTCSMCFTLKNCSRLRRGDFRYTTILYPSTLSKHFIQTLYQSTLSKHFIQALYQSILSKHLIKALCHSTLSKHFIKALQRYYEGVSKHI